MCSLPPIPIPSLEIDFVVSTVASAAEQERRGLREEEELQLQMFQYSNIIINDLTS